MRIDQYLWCIRIFKSRNIASNACKGGKIKINDQIIKPSRELLPLDIVHVRRDQFWRSYRVLELPKSRISAKLVGLYCLEITDNDLLKQKKLKGLSSNITRYKGTGRPTKKERREIDEIHFNEEFDD